MADFSKQAKTILEARYLKRDSKGNLIETPDELLLRVAECVAMGEGEEERDKVWCDKFLSIMDSLEFLPNSPTLINAGRPLGQLSACFVLDLQDSIEDIFETLKQAAIIHKTGGGTGFNFSRLRPKNANVNSTHGLASGPVSFMKVFNTTTEVVKQGGVRRGANLAVLNVTHTDIEEFITCKRDTSQIENFNISVGLNGDFLLRAKNNGYHLLTNPRTREKTEVAAKKLFELMIKSTWETGEPGVIFLDIINHYNPVPQFGRIWSTNPCGEQPLLPDESCNLGSINISKFYCRNDVNFSRLEEVVRIAVRFLDDVIDVNRFPNVKIRNKTRLTRKIGLGVMGWADLLTVSKIKYGSPESFELGEKVVSFIKRVAIDESKKLAKEKGEFYPGFKRRNATVLTIAPTGTLSLIADCSSSIEPHFAKEYTKTVLNGVKLEVVRGDLDKNYIVTAHELSAEQHIRMQAVFQKYVDNAVSKTINLPHEAKEKDIKDGILLAHSLGCKGVTFYRDGTRKAPLEATTEGQLSECDSGKCVI